MTVIDEFTRRSVAIVAPLLAIGRRTAVVGDETEMDAAIARRT
jgi:hypothetical protein